MHIASSSSSSSSSLEDKQDGDDDDDLHILPKVFALDCEMCEVQGGQSELIRVSLINHDSEVLLLLLLLVLLYVSVLLGYTGVRVR